MGAILLLLLDFPSLGEITWRDVLFSLWAIGTLLLLKHLSNQLAAFLRVAENWADALIEGQREAKEAVEAVRDLVDRMGDLGEELRALNTSVDRIESSVSVIEAAKL
jgi:hypothetical protein